MIVLRNMQAVFMKQILDTSKNMEQLILFIVYPTVAFVMLQAIGGQTESSVFFIATFATMHCVFTPIVCTSNILAEEKEKNTLRMLVLSGVKPLEYICSIGFFVWIAVMVTGSSFFFMGKYDFGQSSVFLLYMTAGCVVSVICGMCIGIYAQNAMAANALAVPIGMVFAFLPMLAFFNKTIEKAAYYTYSYQIAFAFQKIGGQEKSLQPQFFITVIYLFVLFVLFSALFQKKKWE